MRPRLIVGVVALAFAAAGCGGVRDAIHSRPGAPSTRFVSEELVDVLPVGRVPAIRHPRFESIGKATDWLGDGAPVLVLTAGADARAYPLAILIWHEIVDDVVGGVPVAVTYSPLTGSAIVFDRRVAGRTEIFDVSGKLYRSGLVMYDRHTRSLWPQLLGRAALGPARGSALTVLPAQVASFGTFSVSFPSGSVLSRDTGAERAYGFNPYAGYDQRTAPFSGFFVLRADPRRPAMERVVGVTDAGTARAYPYATLREAGVLDDRIDDRPIVVLWRSGTRSTLDDAAVARGRDVGSASVFSPIMRGRRLDFTAAEAGFRDTQTGSTWTALGVATAGPLKGARLDPIPYVDAFWFAWAAFRPGTTIAVI